MRPLLNNSSSTTNDEKKLTPGWIKSALKGESFNDEGKLQFLGFKIIEGDYFFKFSDSINSMYNFVINCSKLNNLMRKLKKFSIVTVKKSYRKGFSIELEDIEVNSESSNCLIHDKSIDKIEFINKQFMENLVSHNVDGSYDETHPFFSQRTPILRKNYI